MGPQGPGAFAPDETVVCDYIDEPHEGRSPKFTCALGREDKVKVKYGLGNGEVYAEVAATRLLWALGFGADREYPVHVVCLGCPSSLHGVMDPTGHKGVFDIATIERKMPGHELDGPQGPGWAWKELNLVSAAEGGATPAERDALKLMAVVLQHSDSKAEQQRLACVDKVQDKEAQRATDHPTCDHTFMLINDLGLTFGRASLWNSQQASSVNLELWSQTPVWRDATGCVGNLRLSNTGTLENPVISESGRRFLAGLLTQLTDRQLRDLFEVARFPLVTRLSSDAAVDGPVQAWVNALKDKVSQIVNRTCPPVPSVPNV